MSSTYFLLVVTLTFRVTQVRKSRRIKAKKQAENSEEAEVVENGEEGKHIIHLASGQNVNTRPTRFSQSIN